MNTLNAHAVGPFTVQTSEPQFLCDSTYHAILNREQAEVARVHCGDDTEAARKLAKQFAAAPDLIEALQLMVKAFEKQASLPNGLEALVAARLALIKAGL